LIKSEYEFTKIIFVPIINFRTMKAMKLTGIRQMEMKEIPEPVIAGPKDA
jgi:hypothetical protein